MNCSQPVSQASAEFASLSDLEFESKQWICLQFLLGKIWVCFLFIFFIFFAVLRVGYTVILLLKGTKILFKVICVNWKHDWQLTLYVGGRQFLEPQWAYKSTAFGCTLQQVFHSKDELLVASCEVDNHSRLVFGGKGFEMKDRQNGQEEELNVKVFCQQSQLRQMASSTQSSDTNAIKTSLTQMWIDWSLCSFFN